MATSWYKSAKILMKTLDTFHEKKKNGTGDTRSRLINWSLEAQHGRLKVFKKLHRYSHKLKTFIKT